jgi:hypothetical protein
MPDATETAPHEHEPVVERSEDNDVIEPEIPLRPLGVSEILDGSITFIRRNPRAALGMSAVLTVVIQAIITLAQYFVLGAQARSELTPSVIQRSLGGAALVVVSELLLTIVVVLLLGGLLAPVMARMLLSRSTSLARAWVEVRGSLPRLAGAAATALGAVLVAAVLPFVPVILAITLRAPAGAVVVAWLIGVPVAAVLTVGSCVWLALTTPILVLERRGVFAALKRSAEIIRGKWWRTFGTLVLTLTITLFAQIIVLPLPFVVIQRVILSERPEPTGWALLGFVAVGAVGRIIAGTLLNPFNAGVMTLLYADRRMRREAFDLELAMDPPSEPLDAWLPGPLTSAGSGHQPRMPRHAPPMGWHS